MKGLFLSYNSLKVKASGGALISSRNFNYFFKLNSEFYCIDYYDSDDILLDSSSRKTTTAILKNIIKLQTLSFNISFLDILFNRIDEENFDFIFLDSTLFGSVAKKIKNKHPKIKIITYSHNIELTSSLHSILYEFSFKKIYTLVFSLVNEKYCSKYSDYLIGISSHDNKVFKNLYNREFDTIIPVTIEDENTEIDIKRKYVNKLKILFIGSYFYPNIHGIKWFIDNVLDNIDADLTVVGSGMSVFKKQYVNHNKVVFHDYVEDLEDYYKKSHIVISPIFIGSGMKVKIAEALMFGKIIIGTQLSFQGYKINNADCYTCNTKEEFVNKIIDLQYLSDTDLNYSESSRKTYLDLYSDLNINNYFLPVNNFIIDDKNE